MEIQMEIETDRLFLKAFNSNSMHKEAPKALLKFVSDDKEDFLKYETAKSADFYTLNFQKRTLDLEYKLMTEGKYIRYYVFLKNEPSKIIGTVSFSMYRGIPYCSLVTGYKFAKDYRNRGYCTEALKGAFRVIFSTLNVHQIYAYIMPSNIPSEKVVQNADFLYEGLSIKCLKVQNKWEDHKIYKILNPFETA